MIEKYYLEVFVVTYCFYIFLIDQEHFFENISSLYHYLQYLYFYL